MTGKQIGRGFGWATLAAAAVLSVGAEEKKLRKEQLPAAVAAAVDRESKGAEIKGYATEKEHGKQVYEAETMLNGHSRDLQFAVDGTLNEVEEEVSMDSLDAAVKAGLMGRAKGAQITKVESLMKHGRLVAYEAATVMNGKKGEIQVGPHGEKPGHEE